MKKKEQIHPLPTVSKLDNFSLSFEFDKTLPEIKRTVRIRTDTSL